MQGSAESRAPLPARTSSTATLPSAGVSVAALPARTETRLQLWMVPAIPDHFYASFSHRGTLSLAIGNIRTSAAADFTAEGTLTADVTARVSYPVFFGGSGALSATALAYGGRHTVEAPFATVPVLVAEFVPKSAAEADLLATAAVEAHAVAALTAPFGGTDAELTAATTARAFVSADFTAATLLEAETLAKGGVMALDALMSASGNLAAQVMVRYRRGADATIVGALDALTASTTTAALAGEATTTARSGGGAHARAGVGAALTAPTAVGAAGSVEVDAQLTAHVLARLAVESLPATGSGTLSAQAGAGFTTAATATATLTADATARAFVRADFTTAGVLTAAAEKARYPQLFSDNFDRAQGYLSVGEPRWKDIGTSPYLMHVYENGCTLYGGTTDGSYEGFAIWNQPTWGDNQFSAFTIAATNNGNLFSTLVLRSNVNRTRCVIAGVYAGTLIIWSLVDGAVSELAKVNRATAAGSRVEFSAIANVFTITVNSVAVLTYTDTTGRTYQGESYRYVGIGSTSRRQFFSTTWGPRFDNWLGGDAPMSAPPVTAQFTGSGDLTARALDGGSLRPMGMVKSGTFTLNVNSTYLQVTGWAPWYDTTAADVVDNALVLNGDHIFIVTAALVGTTKGGVTMHAQLRVNGVVVAQSTAASSTTQVLEWAFDGKKGDKITLWANGGMYASNFPFTVYETQTYVTMTPYFGP